MRTVAEDSNALSPIGFPRDVRFNIAFAFALIAPIHCAARAPISPRPVPLVTATRCALGFIALSSADCRAIASAKEAGVPTVILHACSDLAELHLQVRMRSPAPDRGGSKFMRCGSRRLASSRRRSSAPRPPRARARPARCNRPRGAPANSCEGLMFASRRLCPGAIARGLCSTATSIRTARRRDLSCRDPISPARASAVP